MNTDFDLNDLILEATAEVQEIVREVLEEFALPQIKRAVKQTWLSAPDEMKEQFAQGRPEEYAQLMSLIGQ